MAAVVQLKVVIVASVWQQPKKEQDALENPALMDIAGSMEGKS